MTGEIALICDARRDPCELDGIRGSLWARGLSSRVHAGAEEAGAIGGAALAVVLAPAVVGEPLGRWLAALRVPRVLAGHAVTLAFLEGELAPGPDEVLVYGEPGALVAALAVDAALRRDLQGRAVLGPLLDLRRYRAPPPCGASVGGPLVLVSRGCRKRCGFCTYGAVYQGLYPGVELWRSRPPEAVREDAAALVERGARRIWLGGEQVLSADADENEGLRLLARDPPLRAADGGRVQLHLNASPPEVLANEPLVRSLAGSFDLHLRLGVESFDDEALALLDVPHDARTALRAVELLAGLRLPLRLNYILVRPGTTPRTIAAELGWLAMIDRRTPHLSVAQRWLLALDFCSGSLEPRRLAPLARKLPRVDRYLDDLPAGTLERVLSLRDTLEREWLAVEAGTSARPIEALVAAGGRGPLEA